MTSFDKAAVAQRFSRAAGSYDAVAEVQRAVGDWLFKSIHRQQEITSALDVGCGSGALTVQLAERLPMAEIDAIDIAEGMLDVAAAEQAHPRVAYYVGDAEAIPFEEKAFDLVYCNFVLQWCPDPARALAEMRRVLRRGGQLALSVPARGSLSELAAAWRTTDTDTHVHEFPDENRLATLVEEAGFAHADIIQRRLRLHVPDALALMGALKALGARNLDPARPRRLTGKAHLARVIEAYEQRRSEAGLPVSWNVLLLEARR